MNRMTLPSIAPASPAITPVNEPLILRQLIRDLEYGDSATRSLIDLARTYGVKSRSLYDLVSICTVFGVCQRPSNNTVEWFGLSRATQAIELIRQRALEESSTQSLQSVCDSSTNLTLSTIAEAVVRLFFILDVRFLDIKKLAVLFSHRKAKYKTLLRKVYTVANGLELAGIVTRTFAVSEIKLNVSLQIGTKIEYDVAAILNSKEELERAAIAAKRRKEYDQVSIAGSPPVIRRELVDPIAKASFLDALSV
jgi:hypothetical protein